MICKYCKNKNQNRPIIRSKDETAGLEVGISNGCLTAKGWHDTLIGIQPEEVRISYCPMCGRRLL